MCNAAPRILLVHRPRILMIVRRLMHRRFLVSEIGVRTVGHRRPTSGTPVALMFVENWFRNVQFSRTITGLLGSVTKTKNSKTGAKIKNFEISLKNTRILIYPTTIPITESFVDENPIALRRTRITAKSVLPNLHKHIKKI